MGITISYRGKLADLDRIEDFEDRVLDFALEMGGLAQIWRSYAEDTLQRMVRGVILHLAPGQDATSLLVSPEGWLIGLVDIADAEHAKLSISTNRSTAASSITGCTSPLISNSPGRRGNALTYATARPIQL